jgi:flagellar biosynthesis regulator FlaF
MILDKEKGMATITADKLLKLMTEQLFMVSALKKMQDDMAELIDDAHYTKHWTASSEDAIKAEGLLEGVQWLKEKQDKLVAEHEGVWKEMWEKNKQDKSLDN